MSIVKFWHVVCTILSHSFSGRSGPGLLGPVRKILVVRSGPEGPQFARSVGTLYLSEFRSFFGRIKDIIICFRDLLTFDST
jgi:hypothetical protein